MSNELNQLEIREIMDMLPHRYPFLLVDRVLDYKENEYLRSVKNVSVNEPQFTGHFPHQPVFPGVMILEAMAQSTGLLAFKSAGALADNELFLFASVDKARFRKPVVPGDVMHMEVKLLRYSRGVGKFHCVATVDGDVVCEAELMCARREM